MSLDFSLSKPISRRECVCTCGHKHEADHSEEVASFNITHNLCAMAQAAGIYGCLWHPEEQNPPITTAGQCVSPLRAGLAAMKADPQRFRPMSASNGWGTYEQFLPWLELVLAACEADTDALVSASI